MDTDRNQAFVGDISFKTFFDEYWRKKPLFVKNGAIDLTGSKLKVDEFSKLVKESEKGSPQFVKRRGEDVVFVEGISKFDDKLRSRASWYAAVFGVPTAWYDGVQTTGLSLEQRGIGTHFDHSDNFVLQQSGTKRWTVAPPSNLSEIEIAKRMLNISSVGGIENDLQHGQEFVVEAGDLLYLPLFWPHGGVSSGASLSLSLVLPALSYQAVFIDAVKRQMSEQLLGYQPVSTFHKSLPEVEVKDIEAKVTKVTALLLARMTSKEFTTAVAEKILARLSGLGNLSDSPDFL